ncbi:hypothetical protein K461DRAFT_315859 [Myriangium duriaei CBS 260.36]|uniref:Arylsulfotransferase N-terminal domain-containing protein n=1 Tax=Myriangium duriaei CBS 260.36 TaxID=1168546 RepID=A0A9P4MCM3_9PEZI|nr:hypothetical protein K461DRAFT_315859 [Myriangium duriaei CBS 260.36]
MQRAWILFPCGETSHLLIFSMSCLWLAGLLALRGALADQEPKPAHDPWGVNEFESFFTRPDIRAPRWELKHHIPGQDAPGFFFLAPFTREIELAGWRSLLPCFAGPHIYDQSGDLVWSGACVERRRDAWDFRPFQANNETHLSFIHDSKVDCEDYSPKGYGALMDAGYHIYDRVFTDNASEIFNIHEFQVIDHGRKAMFFSSHKKKFNIFATSSSQLKLQHEHQKAYFADDTLIEMNIDARSINSQWSPHDNGVTASESYSYPDQAASFDDETHFWDFFHANSVELTTNRDYIISARHVNTIYRVDRRTGHIVWRLGGKQSDFQQDFNFSSQHDARIVSENSTTIILSFLDNASDYDQRQKDTALISTGKLIAIDLKKKVATLIRQWERPDGRLTQKRGNLQPLGGEAGNVLICWSDHGYVTEHDQHGRLILEARFASDRLHTYRAYKAPFVGRPSEPPVLKSFVRDQSDGSGSRTVSYVSWNGATEVRTWTLYGKSSEEEKWTAIQTVPKTGFETNITSNGHWSKLVIEGLDINGQALGRSDVQIFLPRARNSTTSDMPSGDVVLPETQMQPWSARPLTIITGSHDTGGVSLLRIFVFVGVLSVLGYRFLRRTVRSFHRSWASFETSNSHIE